MKIFNWVHRKFNNKDELAESARKNVVVSSVQVDHDESSTNNNDKKFLFENNARFCNRVFDEWKGGILSIGTFGYDPLIKEEDNAAAHVYFYDEKEQVAMDDDVENESDDSDDNEVNPLMYAAYTHDYEGLLEMEMGEKRDDHEYFEFSSMIKNTNKASRTTLAQLFSADSDKKQEDHVIIKKGSSGEFMNIKDQQKLYSNNNNNKQHGSISFAKKLQLIGEDHARPIHKLNRLMRRMMKRKIHPADSTGVNCKYNPINSNLVPKKYCSQKMSSTESASLLIPTQDHTSSV